MFSVRRRLVCEPHRNRPDPPTEGLRNRHGHSRVPEGPSATISSCLTHGLTQPKMQAAKEGKIAALATQNEKNVRVCSSLF
jgi:hypothetical protein